MTGRVEVGAVGDLAEAIDLLGVRDERVAAQESARAGRRDRPACRRPGCRPRPGSGSPRRARGWPRAAGRGRGRRSPRRRARTRRVRAGRGSDPRRRRRPARRSVARHPTPASRSARIARGRQARLVAEHDQRRIDTRRERPDPDAAASSTGLGRGPGCGRADAPCHSIARSTSAASSPTTTTTSSMPDAASRSRTCWRIGRPSSGARSLPPTEPRPGAGREHDGADPARSVVTSP